MSVRNVILHSIAMWQEAARPFPTRDDASRAFGIHLEKVREMLAAIELDQNHEYIMREAEAMLKHLSEMLTSGDAKVVNMDRVEVLNGCAEQIVTAVGLAHSNNLDVLEACYRVDVANWSKFDEHGQPIFDENGKVKEGPNYRPANLTGLY